jgi:hypothetical protein
MINQFLRTADADRVLRTLQKLSHHGISGWVLTGGLAVEITCLRGGQPPSVRQLNDIDFITSAFDCIPETLSENFLFRHVHPLDPPGKTILQLVDAETALRIDLFRAHGAIMTRAIPVDLPSGIVQLISPGDLLARGARLLLALRRGNPVPAKHASDYLRLEKVTQPAAVETAWQDHRRPDHPATFREASSLIRGLTHSHRDFLITPEYSKDFQVCPRCTAIDAFPLADSDLILSLLGYC